MNSNGWIWGGVILFLVLFVLPPVTLFFFIPVVFFIWGWVHTGRKIEQEQWEYEQQRQREEQERNNDNNQQ